jgi:RNA polymerase sigma factor for flagellar operon FliA
MSETLWERYLRTRSLEDRNHLIELYDYLPQYLAKKAAMKLRLGGQAMTDENDILNDARLGLMDALPRYDPAKGYGFPTFAYLRINGEIYDGIRNRDHLSRTHRKSMAAQGLEGPRTLSTSNAFDGARGVFDKDFGNYDGTPPTDVEDFWREMLRGMDRTERLIMICYFRLEMTMSQIGRHIGTSESRVSQRVTALRNRLQRAHPELVAALERETKDVDEPRSVENTDACRVAG